MWDHSLDRPEDRPYTLLWNSTQNAATITIQLLMTLYFEERENKPLLALVPVIIVGLGDGTPWSLSAHHTQMR